LDLGIRGKTALVLAGGGGLGRAIAFALAREGAQIAVADANETSLNEVAGALSASGAKAIALPWRLGDQPAIDTHIGQIERQLGSVDILISLTGGPPPSEASGQQPDVWRRHFEEMVLSVIGVADRVLPGMKARRWGRLITSTSSGIIAPIPNLAISNALRLSLLGWSKSLAREIAKEGITANVIVPGRIATGRIRYLDEQKAQREDKRVEEVIAASTASIPVGRYGEPEEYAAVVAFLASNAASYVTGSVIRVDGGLIASI
jgi:3-oxoacyl-[acyl-carrier protein] reductase